MDFGTLPGLTEDRFLDPAQKNKKKKMQSCAADAGLRCILCDYY